MVENSVLARMIYEDLESVCDPSIDYVGCNGERPSEWARRVSIVNTSLMRIAPLTKFRVSGKKTYFYTGKIYEEVLNKTIVYEAIKRHLRMHGVSEVDIMRQFKYMLGAFFSQLVLDCEINPKYHIQAYRNGVLNLNTLEFTKHSQEYDVTYLHDFDYDPKADCPTWKAFLRQVLPETASRAILQMYLGLCTFDRGAMRDKVENCLMLYGTGANGKSVIFETITGIFGRDNISNAGLNTLLASGDEGMRSRYYIDGKIINVCPEIQAKNFAGKEDAFKSLCSGEPQIARQIGGDIYTMYNVPRLIFNMNNIPKSEDGSIGFYRRFLYLVFDVVIAEKDQNRSLADQLRAEYPGILNWIIRGGKLLEKNGYAFPASDNASRMMLKNIAEKNITLSWFRARKIRTEKVTSNELGAWVLATDLLEDVRAYADLNGFETCTDREFGRCMREIGFATFRSNKKRTAAGAAYYLYGFDPAKIGTDIPIVMDDSFVDEKDDFLPYDINDL